MKIFQLEGFNGKARVIEENGVSKLYSYETHVADYDHNSNSMKVYGWYSATTGSHINSFLEFYGFEKCTKKELFNLYSLKK